MSQFTYVQSAFQCFGMWCRISGKWIRRGSYCGSLCWMITNRFLQVEDYALLSASLTTDEYHTTTTPLFFVEPETICLVYEDEKGPVLFLRGKATDIENKRVLQLDIQYVSNSDGRRNIRTMLDGFPVLVAKAKLNGFNEITFNSDVPLLRAFCTKRLGFQEDEGLTLRFVIQ